MDFIGSFSYLLTQEELLMNNVIEKEHIFVVDRWQGTYFTNVKIDMNKDIVSSLLGKHFIIDDMQFSFTLELLMREYTTVFLITNFITLLILYQYNEDFVL